jgi:hypothetical protein
MDKITIVLPRQSLTGAAEKLVHLTEQLNKVTDSVAHGFLGGEFGYGAKYENNVFLMRPFCWCGKPDCLWCFDFEDEDEHVKQIRERFGDWSAAYQQAPNFWYKPKNWQVRWYKYIGRGMEQSSRQPKNWLEVCLSSLNEVQV